LPRPKGSRGAGNLKFTIYVPLVIKIHHIKFENNWSSGYQEEVKNVEMLSCLAPLWGQNRYPEDYKFHNFGRSLPVYINIHSVFPPHVWLWRRILKIWVVFDPPSRPLGGQGP
jgi:hypothetical protein